jgi:DNA helicase II / ATP-dependent DNA helicase PcrA
VTYVERDDLLRGLDAQQRHAVTTTASPLAIVAAAGSGKTTVLTRRIAHRVVAGTADPRHVLALTFTRDAASELRRRLRRLDIREPIETGTFHAVALRLLRDRALSNDVAAPQVVTDRHRLMKEVLTETKIRCEIGGALADLDWATARLVEPRHFTDANRAVRRRAALSGEAFTTVADRYRALKRRRGVLDFDDLLVELLAHLQRDPTFADIVRWRFRHLFVDEAQDLNPLQHAVLEQIRGGRADVCLVGDHRQAIYGWNGADPAVLMEVEQQLPGVTVVALTGNYRCSPQIVRAGAAALSGATIADDTESRRADGRAIRILTMADEHAEATEVGNIARALAERHGTRHVAVLARTNDQLVALGRALERLGVPTVRAVGASPLERGIAEAARCTTREQLAAWVDGVWADGSVDAIRSRIAEEADRFLASGEPGGFRSWLDARQPFDDLEPDDDEGAVALLTFHAAKGREWRAVVVTGVEEGLVPHGAAVSAAQRAEEARLLYVALTRAEDELIITGADTRGGQTTGPSPWIDAVRSTIDDSPVVSPPTRLHAPRPPDPLAPLREWRMSVARNAGVSELAICSDATLKSLISDPPADLDELARRLSIGHAAAERLAPRLFTAMGSGDHASVVETPRASSR